MKRIALGLLAATALTFSAHAEPAIIYDLGGKFDKSFNEAAYNGAEKYKEETGTSYREFEIQNDAQREQALLKFAEDGNSPIVVAGFSWAQALEQVAKDFPDTKFAIIDMVVDQPNVRSVVFKEQEGSYLAGVMAAKASETGTVSFVGGMGIPLISRFACGYVGGVKSVNADAKVIENMTGDTPAAWNDPVKGGEITKAQIAQGSDVVFHAAGGTGVGVIQAAADAGKLAIGVDSNQNGLQPGSVLTSMVKKVDVAVYEAFKDGAEGGTWESGINVLGLKEGGVDVAMDDNNKELVSEEMMKAVEDARAKIVSGDVVVHDYMSDNNCPY
ncbi:BMP family lipoprotein [Ahrensia marina]|uniref:Membrane protein n=1 Tax=Ahrensia marina TaxID=1514904 RepID=A0A0M9GNX2_9HYPH|nr:BMP family ABC transporter substrate-binding protein [Ahrensia marina]KPB02223.1 membrane protein [Ahrensia marina]